MTGSGNASGSFRLAPMSPLIFWLTFTLFAMPLVFFAIAIFSFRPFVLPALLVTAIYAWVWLRFRPTKFVVRPDSIEVIWPLKKRIIPRFSITAVRIISKQELLRETGFCMRVGAGGLWGGFGWLWTERRGILQMYISRTDRFVLIEQGSERPWLITPEHPEAFVRALTG